MRPRRVALALAALATFVAGLGMRPARSQPTPCTRPRIVITKHRAELALICVEGTRVFPATFGAQPVGPKLRRGDERTPEGRYHVRARLRPARFHRFLALSYPNAGDRARAAQAGVDPGSGIGIHGVAARYAGVARLFIRGAARVSARVWGPTDGCIGLTNEDVEVVFDAVREGTEVEILP